MPRPVSTYVAATVLGALVLTGCGTGLQAQTYKKRDQGEVSGANVGGIDLRGLAVAAPSDGGKLAKGGDATLTGVLINGTDQPDTLVSVTSDAATSTVLSAGSATGGTEVVVPAGSLTTDPWSATLRGLTEDLYPGQFVDVTFEFKTAGRVKVSVPVQSGDNGVDTRPTRDPYREGEPGAEPSETPEGAPDSMVEPSPTAS